MNVLVMHRLSDVGAAGAAGSHQVRLAEGLLAETETPVVYGQPASEIEHAREVVGLSDTEARILPNLPRGEALWKVGTRSFLVEDKLSRSELQLADTDARMTAKTAATAVSSAKGPTPRRSIATTTPTRRRSSRY